MAKLAIMSLQASDAFSITKSDTDDIVDDPNNSANLYKFCYVHVVGASGDVKVTTVDGTDVTVYGTQGSVIPLLVRRVWSTGTTAGNLVAFVGRNKV